MPSTQQACNERFAIRGPFITFNNNPFSVGDENALVHESDGLIIINDGTIEYAGAYSDGASRLEGCEVKSFPNHLITPGFIDTHVHYPQLPIIGAYGAQLIDWLNTYTFVAEQRYDDLDYAGQVSRIFLDELARNGTTTAAVYCTVHPNSVEAFFQEAHARRLRMIAGKMLMDRNAPEALQDTAQSGYDDSLTLLQKWHEKGRLSYAITPRFAPTSTEAQLEAAGALWKAHPSAYMQTHVSENKDEVEWVKELFPDRANYIDVYAHYGLTGPRALFGHAIYLEETEWHHLAETDSSVIHCPTSNTFLGSGFFNFQRALQPESAGLAVRTGLATDVGGGTSLCMLKSMGEVYKVGQLSGYSVSAAKAFYLATRGAAKALHLDNKIGSIEAGMEADLVVLNPASTPLLEFRTQYCNSIEELLFVQMTLADDRAIDTVYSAGRVIKGA
ncbi:MAG: guanine deaminase [Pusillimonas sp.]|jgi:guanine deaminase|nr:guanine deaminase [Pusillimonas sp.]|tara:strand:+ start:235855 stop:237189 length:1335 start_codon:yes stop_codon:yes gene_type:complete